MTAKRGSLVREEWLFHFPLVSNFIWTCYVPTQPKYVKLAWRHWLTATLANHLNSNFFLALLTWGAPRCGADLTPITFVAGQTPTRLFPALIGAEPLFVSIYTESQPYHPHDSAPTPPDFPINGIFIQKVYSLALAVLAVVIMRISVRFGRACPLLLWYGYLTFRPNSFFFCGWTSISAQHFCLCL